MNQEKQTLTIEGMHCEGCVKRVEKALKAIHAKEVVVSLEKKDVTWENASKEEVKEAIEDLGFTCKEN
jgi:copper chaperone CopZ